MSKTVWNIKLQKRSEIDNLAREFGKARMERILKGVHEQSRTWLQERAVKNLYTAVEAHGRPQNPTFNRSVSLRSTPNVGLRKAILKQSNSRIGRGYVDFMVDARVSKDAPYYHVQEVGSNKMVDRWAPLGFRDAGGLKIKAGEARQGRDGALRGGGKLRIKHGIRGYHYIETTVAEFNKGKVFQDYLDEALKPMRAAVPGVQLTVKKS